jgi:hypothetical protein
MAARVRESEPQLKGPTAMQRREFLAASVATALGVAAAGPLRAAAADEKSGARQFFELRTYHFKSPEKQRAFESFAAEALVPALNRAGVEPVGVFKLSAKDNPNLRLEADPTDLWLLLPHNSLESVVTLEERLANDAAFQDAGKAVLAAPKNNPAFDRYESLMLWAFEKAPRIVPTAAKGENRLFELRTYESHSNERHRNKVGMFNAGEFPVFDRAGMPGVFYGSAVSGPNLPQLTYMIVHPDAADVRKHWSAFGADAEWKKLLGDPSYRDNVSKIVGRFLRPAAGSQL